MKNTSFKQNNFETEVTCREEAINSTTEPLQGSMILYSGHCPHTKCLRHFSMGFTTNRSLRDLTPKCLRHVGVPRLASGREAAGWWKPMPEYVNSSSSHDAGGRWKPMPGYVNNSSGHDAGGWWKPMQKCSQVCGMCVSRPSLYKVLYQGDKVCHRVRSLRDLTQKCLRHVGVARLTSGQGKENREKRIENRIGCDSSRSYDKVVEIRDIVNREWKIENSGGREASRPYDKMVKISGIDFGSNASQRCDKVVKISGLMDCGVERGGSKVNMPSRGKFRRDLRRRLRRRGMCHLRSP